MANAQAIRRSAQVARRQKGLGILVVSATAGTTERILQLAHVAEQKTWNEAKEILLAIESQHHQIAEELHIDVPTRSRIEKLLRKAKDLAKRIYDLRDCPPSVLDSLLSIGERISSTLMTPVLREVFDRPIKWLDIREILKTDEQFGRALPLLSEISNLCSRSLCPQLAQGTIFVTQGFIGSTQKGLTTTLGRGGSDYSAALLAEGIEANELQIWTDVAGVSSTDPKICPTAHLLKELSFSEAAELATFGAKILHPTTVWPTMRKNIPIFVGNSFDCESSGTWIRQTTRSGPVIRAIALRENQSILTLSTPRMVSLHGFLHDIFYVFKKHKTSVDLVSTSEISVSITVEEDILKKKKLIEELSLLGQVKMEGGYGLVSLIGNRINQIPGMGAKILEVISHINIRLICSGASQHNFCFLVDSSEAKKAVRELHQRFLDS